MKAPVPADSPGQPSDSGSSRFVAGRISTTAARLDLALALATLGFGATAVALTDTAAAGARLKAAQVWRVAIGCGVDAVALEDFHTVEGDLDAKGSRHEDSRHDRAEADLGFLRRNLHQLFNDLRRVIVVERPEPPSPT